MSGVAFGTGLEKLPEGSQNFFYPFYSVSLLRCQMTQCRIERSVYAPEYTFMTGTTGNNSSWKLNALIQRQVPLCKVYTQLIYKIWSLLTNKTSFRGACVLVLINWCSSLVVITGTLGNCLFITSITNRKAAIIAHQLLWLRDEIEKLKNDDYIF